MKFKTHRNAVLLAAAFLGVATFTRKAEAQLHPSLYGSAEADTRHTQFYLLGLYVGSGGLGWTPYFDVNGWLLDYAVNGTRTTLSAVNPTIGLAHSSANTGVSFGVGYSWVRNPNLGVPGTASGGDKGVTASFGAYHNGTGRRAASTQFLSEYNFGSQYIWARGRASVPFGYSVRHPARIGLEVVGQGGGKNGITTNEFDVGPTFEYAWTPNFRTTAVVGYKNVGVNSRGVSNRDNAAYFRLEFSLSP
jgi:hypothetical protein